MPPADGCLNFAGTSTNESARAAEYAVGVGVGRSGTATVPTRANLNAARRSASQLPPDFSGHDFQGLTNQQNHHHQHQQGQYYESPRHSKPQAQYQRSPAALTPLSAASSTNSFYTFPSGVDATATMSLSYENPGRTFPSYPPMMHEQPQEEENDLHHRYPSPPPALAHENPYHGPGVDPGAAISMDISELPHKEGSDAPSPGRSRPIPKPAREVTKGEDGRFVCAWPGCTEEMKTFNRKCEWSKVSGCAFLETCTEIQLN